MFQLDGQPSGCPSFVDCKLSFCVALVNSELRVDAQRLSSRGITALPPDVGRGSAVPSAREKVRALPLVRLCSQVLRRLTNEGHSPQYNEGHTARQSRASNPAAKPKRLLLVILRQRCTPTQT